MSMAAISKTKVHKCRVPTCRKHFDKLTSFQTKCVDCLVIAGKLLQQKQWRAETREKKKALREGTRKWWLKKVEEICNRYIRLRDKDLPCISCGDSQPMQWHAGHFKTVKAHPELRFEPLNIHKQCSQCNKWESGNLAQYRPNLLLKIGQEKFAWLNGPHFAKHYTIPDLMELDTHFRELVRQLEKQVTT